MLKLSALFRSLQWCLSLALFWNPALAQNQPASRITQSIDDRIRITLKGNVHPLAQPRYDQGPVSDSFAANRMFLLLQRSPEREAALQHFLQDAHRAGGSNYHRWLTPKQFGALYGPTDSEIAAVSGWLQRQGFSVARVTKGKTAIEFSGTAGQIRSAFHTEIHTYSVNGEQRHANNLDPQIPAALAPLIAGVTPMNDFQPKSYIKVLGKASYDPGTHKFVPNWGFPNGQGLLNLGPGDFAVQYDLNPLYTAGVTGTGVTIGLIGASNVDPVVVATYRSFFGLPASPVNVVIDGLDPGENYAATSPFSMWKRPVRLRLGPRLIFIPLPEPRCRTACIWPRSAPLMTMSLMYSVPATERVNKIWDRLATSSGHRCGNRQRPKARPRSFLRAMAAQPAAMTSTVISPRNTEAR